MIAIEILLDAGIKNLEEGINEAFFHAPCSSLIHPLQKAQRCFLEAIELIKVIRNQQQEEQNGSYQN